MRDCALRVCICAARSSKKIFIARARAHVPWNFSMIIFIASYVYCVCVYIPTYVMMVSRALDKNTNIFKYDLKYLSCALIKNNVMREYRASCCTNSALTRAYSKYRI